MKSIEKRIEKLSKDEVASINENAVLEASKLESNMIQKVKKSNADFILKADNEAKTRVASKKRELELYEKQAVSQIQREIVDGLYNEVLLKMESLKKDDLLNLVIALLKDEKYLGSEEIRVSKKDYSKYLEALSSGEKKAKVDCDKLNSKVKANFYLSQAPADVAHGFVLIGSNFDLSFDFNEILKLVQDKTENEVLGVLF